MRFFENFHTFVSIGPIQIQWYAVCILLGATFSYFFGARIWYVIFTFDQYVAEPLEIFMIWHGGLAIQGGLIAGLVYSYYFFKKKNIPFFVAGDAILPGVLIAQACGRWGNFFNHEAFGGEVSLEFLQSLHLPQFIIDNMYIQGAYHHPTFIYESIGNVIAFLIIIFVIRKFQKHTGMQFFGYFLLYGIVRFPVEGMRTDSLMLGPIRMAQLVSIIFVIIGILGMIYIHRYGDKCINNEIQ